MQSELAVPDRGSDLCPRVVLGINLKMYFDYRQSTRWLIQVRDIARTKPDAVAHADLFVLPPSPMLVAAVSLLSGAGLGVGAQDIAAHVAGPYTGEVAASMVRQIGCSYALVGHADRRQHGEDDTLIGRKLAMALSQGLHPVLCVGEEGDARNTAAATCLTQIAEALAVVPADTRHPITIAYEPIWSIGARSPAPAEHISVVCHSIRQYLRTVRPDISDKVIYGGSAGPGILSDLYGVIDGIFLGRRVHEACVLGDVLDEASEVLGRARSNEGATSSTSSGGSDGLSPGEVTG
jgi:triosephosphate isomerase (TIM)